MIRKLLKRAQRRRRPAPAAPLDLARLTALLNEQSQPNINHLSIATRNLDLMALNIKAFGYSLARQLGAGLAYPATVEPRSVGLGSKLSTQIDIESDWFGHWCRELGIVPVYHRKLWEFAYTLQTLHESGNLQEGKRGLGFGCGTEPMSSYFAARGISVLATDLAPSDANAIGWAATSQHASHLDQAFHAHLVERATFDRAVRLRFIDMNAIPDDLTDYDFCWSICALEHLGSIERGLAFVERSLETLKPGGTAVHTTEFNVNPLGPTIDNWPTVLFQRAHIEALAERLEARGHQVARLNFDAGDRPLDQFIDLPPWHDGTLAAISGALGQPYHLKVGADGFIATCLGLAVTRAVRARS